MLSSLLQMPSNCCVLFLQHQPDLGIGVHLMDRYTFYVLEFLEEIHPASQTNMNDLVSRILNIHEYANDFNSSKTNYFVCRVLQMLFMLLLFLSEAALEGGIFFAVVKCSCVTLQGLSSFESALLAPEKNNQN